MTMIPPCSPLLSYEARKNEIDAAVINVLTGGNYILGPEVNKFETSFAAFNERKHCNACANGTDAIFLALKANNIGVGDKVATVSHTAVATVSAIESTGATPVMIDIEEANFNMSLEILADLLQKEKIKAIVPVHLYGNAVDMTKLMALAQAHDCIVIEDCSQAHGASWNGQKVGTFGVVGTFSFYPTKNLGALGDGGGIVHNSDHLANEIEALKQYGWKKRYISDSKGYNSRLDEIQAAILSVQLKHLDQDTSKRIALAEKYNSLLKDVAEVQPPTHPIHAKHVYHQYVIRCAKRDALQKYLKEQNIITLIHYPEPVHLQPAYLDRGLTYGSLSNTEKIKQEILSLPMFPMLTMQEVAQVCDHIKRFFRV